MANTSALYDQYFNVVPADTPALLDEALALRYQVYCVEHPFEDPSQQHAEREVDAYDSHSVHAVLIYKPSARVVGCVRLILPETGAPSSTLPLRSLLTGADRVRFDQFPRETTAEISRYAVSKAFRRREGEDFYPDVGPDDASPGELRRLAPHMSLGLFRGIARLAADHHVTHVCAAMAPALLRLLERFGLTFERLGPPFDYHGERRACVAESLALLSGLAGTNQEVYRMVHDEYTKGTLLTD